MSKFRKETMKQLKAYLGWYEVDWTIKTGNGYIYLDPYKRNIKRIEHLCILMGDELPEECDWGEYGKEIKECLKDRTKIKFFKDSERMINMRGNIDCLMMDLRCMRFIDSSDTMLIFMLRTFFYYDAKEDL